MKMKAKTTADLFPSLPVEWLLPAILSTTARATDVIGFLALGGPFTAHITGNLVVLAAHYLTGGFGQRNLPMAGLSSRHKLPVSSLHVRRWFTTCDKAWTNRLESLWLDLSAGLFGPHIPYVISGASPRLA